MSALQYGSSCTRTRRSDSAVQLSGCSDAEATTHWKRRADCLCQLSCVRAVERLVVTWLSLIFHDSLPNVEALCFSAVRRRLNHSAWFMNTEPCLRFELGTFQMCITRISVVATCGIWAVRVKGLTADHPLPCSAEVRMSGVIPPPLHFFMACLGTTLLFFYHYWYRKRLYGKVPKWCWRPSGDLLLPLPVF